MFDRVPERIAQETASKQIALSSLQDVDGDPVECPLAWAREANAYVCVGCLHRESFLRVLLNPLFHIQHRPSCSTIK